MNARFAASQLQMLSPLSSVISYSLRICANLWFWKTPRYPRVMASIVVRIGKPETARLRKSAKRKNTQPSP